MIAEINIEIFIQKKCRKNIHKQAFSENTNFEDI